MIRDVPSAFTSSPQSATIVCTSRRGGSTSRISPSPSGKSPAAISKREPGFQSEVTVAPNWYLLRISLFVIASQRRSGVVLM